MKIRIADLEAKLEKRKLMKMNIVDLQLRTIVNEAEGLGFFSGGSTGRRGINNFAPSGTTQSYPVFPNQAAPVQPAVPIPNPPPSR